MMNTQKQIFRRRGDRLFSLVWRLCTYCIVYFCQFKEERFLIFRCSLKKKRNVEKHFTNVDNFRMIFYIELFSDFMKMKNFLLHRNLLFS
jgi:hypothetical protein